MLPHVKESCLTLGEIRMDHIEFGHGSKPLILIQGLNTNGIRGSGPMLSLMYRKFAKDYRVYLFDRRADLPAEITIRELAHDLALAMDTLKLKNADILGVSQGGMIAMCLAIERPDLVRKLVLAVTASRNNETLQRIIEGWVEMTEQHDIKRLITDMAENMYSDAYLKRYRPILPLLTLVQKPKDPSRFLTLAKSCLTCNVYGELPRIQCPTLVIGGSRDKIVTAQASREIAERLGCRLHLYETLGHAAYEEAGDFNEIVLRFFREHE